MQVDLTGAIGTHKGSHSHPPGLKARANRDVTENTTLDSSHISGGNEPLHLRSCSQEIIDVPDLRFKEVNHVVVQAGCNPDRLLEILKSPDFPPGTTVVTPELSLLPLHGDLKDRMEALYDLEEKAKKTPDDTQLAARLTKTRKRVLGEIQGFAEDNVKTGGIPRAYLELSKAKGLTLWLGAPRLDEKTGKVYNSMIRVEKGKVTRVHDKHLLWKGSDDLKLADTPAFSPSSEWDDRERDFETVLICWEAFNLNQSFGKPTKLPEVKEEFSQVPEGDFGVAYIAAYAPVNGGKALRSSVGRMVRREDEENITLGPHGGLAFIANGPVEAALMGPFPDPESPRRKAEVYAALKENGIIIAKSLPDGRLSVETRTVT
ncbi:MAG: hypothetical protein HYU64_14985 [Armatimonadetes bacterium]|nr:hypothetical protein [Armatimonadota bacterium]